MDFVDALGEAMWETAKWCCFFVTALACYRLRQEERRTK